jgi:hypothetical protein
MNTMNKILIMEDKILNIAIKHGLVRPESVASQFDPPLPLDLSTVKSDRGDFYEVPVWAIKAALEDAYKAGQLAQRVMNRINAD